MANNFITERNSGEVMAVGWVTLDDHTQSVLKGKSCVCVENLYYKQNAINYNPFN